MLIIKKLAAAVNQRPLPAGQELGAVGDLGRSQVSCFEILGSQLCPASGTAKGPCSPGSPASPERLPYFFCCCAGAGAFTSPAARLAPESEEGRISQAQGRACFLPVKKLGCFSQSRGRIVASDKLPCMASLCNSCAGSSPRSRCVMAQMHTAAASSHLSCLLAPLVLHCPQGILDRTELAAKEAHLAQADFDAALKVGACVQQALSGG